MSSLVSAKGPSITVRLSPENLTRAPLELGCSPLPSSITPAFTISSLNFAIAASTPLGQKIEPTARRPLHACWDGGQRSEFGRLMQRDFRRPVAALELLAGAAWAWIVAARIRHLVELP